MPETRLISCPGCGATNRVPQEKLDRGLAPVCGRCRTRLAVRPETMTVSDATFAADVESSPLPVVLDVWAPWCGPCRLIGRMIDELASEMAGRVRFAKLNIDQNPATAARYNVSGVPTLLVLQAGRELDRIVGALPKSVIRQRLQQVLAGSTGTPGK
jgi:thioredoxin 2